MPIDLSDFDNATFPLDERGCRVREMLDTLTKERAEKLLAAMATRDRRAATSRKYTYSGERISATLSSWNIRISGSMIDKHRRGGCGCPPLI